MDLQSSVRYIAVGIDGTGSAKWRKPDGSNSSVYKFIKSFNYGAIGIDRQFFDGPSDTTFGMESEPVLQHAIDFIYHRLQDHFPQLTQRHVRPLTMFDVNSCHQNAEYQRMAREMEYGFVTTPSVHLPLQVTTQMLAGQILSTNQVRIVIVGHSRGGLIATLLARMLSPIVKVYFLGLYDAVDRQPCLDGSIIQNVEYVFHARRHPDVGSRSYFSNTSTSNPSGHYEEQFFYTSHGGIGGSIIPGQYDDGITADYSCRPQPPVRIIYGPRGIPIKVDNINPLTRRFGKPIDKICEEGGHSADAYIRAGARRFGLPVQ